MRVGEVIVQDGKADVIVELRRDGGYATIPLEEFVMKNTVIRLDGESKTIREIVNERCNSYMNGVTIHER